MLDKEFQYYLEHQQELASKYNGKYIVIVGDSVVVHERSTVSEAKDDRYDK